MPRIKIIFSYELCCFHLEKIKVLKEIVSVISDNPLRCGIRLLVIFQLRVFWTSKVPEKVQQNLMVKTLAVLVLVGIAQFVQKVFDYVGVYITWIN